MHIVADKTDREQNPTAAELDFFVFEALAGEVDFRIVYERRYGRYNAIEGSSVPE